MTKTQKILVGVIVVLAIALGGVLYKKDKLSRDEEIKRNISVEAVGAQHQVR